MKFRKKPPAMDRPIAGAGFALNAMRLACIRTLGWCAYRYPHERHEVDRPDSPSAEFYRITDKATEAWIAAEHWNPCYECVRTRL